jgi:LmbE family N-acetylglucosaminyl deacetylase
MMNTDEPSRRLLAISAHPDDVEFTSGGSLARWAAEGWATYLVVCTDGSKGSQNPRDTREGLALARRHEQEAAAEALGVTELIWLGHRDGELARVPDLVEELAQQIRRIRPDRLLAWDAWRPYELHPDHRAAGLAAVDAVLAAGNPHFYPEQLQEEPGLQPQRVEEVYLFGTDQRDMWVDITATFERKMAAIACHASQIAGLRDLALKMSYCNQGYAQGHGVTYAEVFKVLHPFCDT